MRKIILLLSVICILSSKEDFTDPKRDIELVITNKSDKTIPKIKVDGVDGIRSWTFENVASGKSESITYNIKKDFKRAEGGIIITSFKYVSDSITLDTGYFTNYQYNGPTSFSIYDSEIKESM